MKLSPRRALCWLAALFFGALAAAADPDGGQDTYAATVDRDGVQRVRIVAGSYFFKPQRITVKMNVPVELSVSRESGIVPHTLTIQAPQAGIEVDENLSAEVRKFTFTPTVAGAYAFYCKNKLPFQKSHRDRGQEGVLEVVP